MLDDFKVRVAVDTIARALRSDGSEVKLLGFDAGAGEVRIGARLNSDCERCVMTSDQLRALVQDMVERQLGRPMSVLLSEL